jgi:hypothetical protein
MSLMPFETGADREDRRLSCRDEQQGRNISMPLVPVRP